MEKSLDTLLGSENSPVKPTGTMRASSPPITTVFETQSRQSSPLQPPLQLPSKILSTGPLGSETTWIALLLREHELLERVASLELEDDRSRRNQEEYLNREDLALLVHETLCLVKKLKDISRKTDVLNATRSVIVQMTLDSIQAPELSPQQEAHLLQALQVYQLRREMQLSRYPIPSQQ